MKNKILFFILLLFIFCPTTRALDVIEDDYFHWLKDNNLIVKEDTLESYNNDYNNITKGTVFLNYDLIDKTMYRPRELMISTALMGDSLIYAYKKTNTQEYLDLAILIANNIIDHSMYTHNYPRDVNGLPLNLVVSQKNMVSANLVKAGGTRWGYNEEPEIYMNSMLFVPWFFLELHEVTNNQIYLDTALDILDSVIYIQDKYGQNGALPDFLFFYDTTGASWIKPLDIAYPYYLSFSKAYEITKDNKYKESMDSYFSFVFDALENKNGTFSFNKDGVDYILPYEKIGERGVNQDNYDGSYNENNDITTDQLFYTVLGIVNYDKNNYYSKEFTKAIKAISVDNTKFYGEYTISGDKGSHAETVVESVNSGFYLELLKVMGSNVEELGSIYNYIYNKMLVSDDVNVDGGYVWNFDTEEPHVIESLATAVLLKNAYEAKLYIDENTIVEPIEDPVEEEPKEETPTEKEEEVVEEEKKEYKNPETGAFVNYLSIVSCIIISFVIIINIMKKRIFYKI